MPPRMQNARAGRGGAGHLPAAMAPKVPEDLPGDKLLLARPPGRCLRLTF
ncbi:hypothetical protein HMPREF0262_02010 [Clostridium sp. ATCC 29733]|nr:hypothetical protein HMPREF0262_02010 [Clostridium sp. ATCC 29733]